jgi:hypothetical protein
MEIPHYDYCLLDVMPCILADSLQLQAAGTSRALVATHQMKTHHILNFDIMC